MSQRLRRRSAIPSAMHHALMLALVVVWVVTNLFLWSLKQSPVVLFWQSLGTSAIAYPMLYLYVTRRR